MKTWIVLLLIVGLHNTAAVIHSLKYFFMTSFGVPNFPDCVAVALVDGVQITHYDSHTGRAEPKPVWMNRVTEDDPLYWQSLTELAVSNLQEQRAMIEVLKQRFNQTGGVHIYQQMVGCELDDETFKFNGYYQTGYDGEDFISFDLKTETWIAPKQQAVITKRKWDVDKAYIDQTKHFITQYCPGWLKKFVNYGSSSLLRTELPSLSFLQKTPSSPISCHATGFYPERAALFWRKDGEDLHEDVDLGEILPNHDGTFQMSADLKLSVALEDRRRYDCVFQLSGVKDNIVTRLEVIRSNKEEPTDMTIPIIAAVLVLALVLSLSVIGFVVYRKKNVKVSRDDADGKKSQRARQG